jgi:hypothetical protein
VLLSSLRIDICLLTLGLRVEALVLVIAEMLNGDRSHGSYGASVSAVSVRRLQKGVFGSAIIVLEVPNTQLKLYGGGGDRGRR